MKKQTDENKGFFLVGKRWNYSRNFNGKRYRISTGCQDLKEAKEWLKYYHPDLLHDGLKSPEPEIFVSSKKRFKFTDQWFSETLYRICYRNKGNGASRISKSFLSRLVARSKGRCELTGIPFNTEKINGAIRLPFAPSVDRINSNLPYGKENCRLVCLAVNISMNGWGEKLFDFIARERLKQIECQKVGQSKNTEIQ